jgi:hypothetical protein
MKAKRKRSPAAKKQLDYKKQRRGFSEYAHALRHGKWRRNKRRPAQQVERQTGRIAIATRASAELRDPGFDPGAIARPTVRKWGAAALGDWVPRQQRVRAERVGAKKRRKVRAR